MSHASSILALAIQDYQPLLNHILDELTQAGREPCDAPRTKARLLFEHNTRQAWSIAAQRKHDLYLVDIALDTRVTPSNTYAQAVRSLHPGAYIVGFSEMPQLYCSFYAATTIGPGVFDETIGSFCSISRTSFRSILSRAGILQTP
ncbi:MAG: hypothetical protein HC945_03465 [Nitrosarchaeum sp.]|nr:hypothetical protein [Nitrosarchaeum sp.]